QEIELKPLKVKSKGFVSPWNRLVEKTVPKRKGKTPSRELAAQTVGSGNRKKTPSRELAAQTVESGKRKASALRRIRSYDAVQKSCSGESFKSSAERNVGSRDSDKKGLSDSEERSKSSESRKKEEMDQVSKDMTKRKSRRQQRTTKTHRRHSSTAISAALLGKADERTSSAETKLSGEQKSHTRDVRKHSTLARPRSRSRSERPA
ncbi:unnamed protein product, partial [Cylicocyclus nassatus]